MSGSDARGGCAVLMRYECLNRGQMLRTGNVVLCGVAALVNCFHAVA